MFHAWKLTLFSWSFSLAGSWSLVATLVGDTCSSLYGTSVPNDRSSSLFIFLTTLVVLLYRRWYQLTGTNMGNLPSTAYCRRCCVSSLLFLFKDENNDLNRFFICAFIPCEINDRHQKNQHRQRNGLSPMWKLLRR